MRDNPDFGLDNREAIKELIRGNPWCTFISAVPDRGLVASHYPVLLDEAAEDIALLSHVGRPDEEKHELGRHEMLAIIEGPNGYISPSWYGYRPNVPTWNFVVAHLHGTPEILGDEENLAILDRLVEHFEKPLPEPHYLHATAANGEYAYRIAKGTVGFRLRVRRLEAKEKMNQDKSEATVRRILEELRKPGPYTNHRLASRMAVVNGLERESK
ncbi:MULTISPECIES: FMN-binding negative transcriptional regulator [unclassified Brevibacterium]|uniref:FMN-binding negative transcriptional regulator n=1 Tax=unclassified Brevibacterium TaxID=2614124 RepID=UPI0010919E75|nr:FMN-binding negative transcriptional regulator [Brevibacterium sp. S22]TGD30259.1 FMN-binding negative transcriptional regulator [Brevibacterium sp. S22]